MNCIDLTSERSKMLSYVPKLQKWSNYDEFASIWCQNYQKCWGTSQNYKTDLISVNLHRFDVKTIKNIELRRKTFKTTQNYKSDQIIMNCIDLTSKRSKMLRYVAKLQKWSNYNALHRFDVITIKTTLNYKRDQITMNLHRFDVKTIKNVEVRRKTTKLIKLQWIASIWRQNDQNFWVRSQNYKSNQITMNCIDLTSKQSKNFELRRKTFKTTQNYKRWSNYNELHRFDIKTI